MKILQKILILSSVLFLFPCLIGGGINSEELHDYNENMLKRAGRGDSSAQFNLAWCCLHGKGISKNYPMAVKWFRLAAEQGHDLAQINLGRCYALGIGTVKNQAEAVKWFRLAAENGNVSAQNILGLSYLYGQGVPKNSSEAVKWFRLAAEKEFAEAQFNLGISYLNGKGVTKDYSLAVGWFRRAARHGHAKAQFQLGLCYQQGKGVIKDQTEAKKWFRQAEKNQVGSQTKHIREPINKASKDNRFFKTAADSTSRKERFPVDPEKELAFAVKSGNRSRQGLVAFEIGIEKLFWNEKDALKFMILASEAGYPKAHWYAFVLSSDPKYCIRAAKAGDSRAYLHAARHIAVNAEKNNLPKDSPEFKMALKWYMDIVKSHDLQAAKDALCNIGFMYRIGEGVKADYNKAMEWYQKAADRGSARAHRELGVKYGIRLRTEQSSYRKISAADDRSGLNPPHVSFNTGNPFDEDAMVRHFAIAAFWGDQPAVKQLDRYLFQIKLPASPRALFFARGVNFLLDNEAKGKDEQQRMKAVKLIEDAAVYDPYANIILAHCFMDGKFMKKDFAKAASYLKRAVSMKNLYAKIVLSKSSMAKYISREERIAYLKDLIPEGIPWARYNLAGIYQAMGNFPQAFDLFEQDAAGGNVHSQLRLFFAIMFGQDSYKRYISVRGSRNLKEKAFDYLRLAAEQNLGDAEAVLGSPVLAFPDSRSARDKAILQIKALIDGIQDRDMRLLCSTQVAHRYAHGNGVPVNLKKAEILCVQCLKNVSPQNETVTRMCKTILAEINKKINPHQGDKK